MLGGGAGSADAVLLPRSGAALSAFLSAWRSMSMIDAATWGVSGPVT